ncbi:MAG TPA: proline dehydrogenase family protein [Mycobacteriales bacterium]
MLRAPILAAARSRHLGAAAARLPGTRAVVARFVPGPGQDDALRACRELTAAGLQVSLDHLGEDTTDLAQVGAVVRAYTDLLTALGHEGLADRVEVSVKLTALGLDIDRSRALGAAHEIASAAAEAGTTVTVDMEDHTRTDVTLDTVAALRRDHPDVGAVLQAYLRRTEADCRDLAGPGSRVRLCKGAYDEPISVAYQAKSDVDSSYLRCLTVLMEGQGYPMIATHDPRLIEAAGRLVATTGRGPGDYEHQLLYGVRPDEQTRLAQSGATVRIYTPYGKEWYGYLMRRLAERPANLRLFLRALASRS